MQSSTRSATQLRAVASRLYHFRPMPKTNFQPCPPAERTKGKFVSAEEAVALTVKDNSKVYSHMGACTPLTLLKTMGTTLNGKVKNVEVMSMHIEGGILPHLKPEAAGSFRHHSMFMGANVRKATNEGRADNQAVFFSDVPNLFRKGIMKSDVAFLNVSPPDQHGWCTMGVSVAACHAAALASKVIVAQINPNVPRTHGDGAIHVNQIDYLVECNDPLPGHPPGEISEQETAIGKHVAALVPDGACLQMGIGAIPDATLSFLKNHKNLGIHTEMFADGVLNLIETGVVNNSQKKVHPGKNILTFMVGSKRLYDFVDNNPTVQFLDVSYTNDSYVIAKNPKVHAINSAIEVDLTGQVVADSIGKMFYSGIGGQMDFVRGAALSEGGKPIIALPSITAKGDSRIVPYIKEGAGVVTSRGHCHYVVTEFGAAYLHGKNNRERSVLLANIAHPSVRPQLFDFIKKRYGRL